MSLATHRVDTRCPNALALNSSNGSLTKQLQQGNPISNEELHLVSDEMNQLDLGVGVE
jgi:hypothetical protein